MGLISGFIPQEKELARAAQQHEGAVGPDPERSYLGSEVESNIRAPTVPRILRSYRREDKAGCENVSCNEKENGEENDGTRSPVFAMPTLG